MTDAAILDVYVRVFDDDTGPDDDRRAAILAEMRGIAAADTLDDALAVVAWWAGSEDVAGLRRDVARARRMLRAGRG